MPYFWDLLLVHRSNIVIAFIDHASPTVNQYSRVKMEGRLIMRNPHGQMYHRNGIIFTRLTECLAISAQTLLSAKSAQELLSRFETIMAQKIFPTSIFTYGNSCVSFDLEFTMYKGGYSYLNQELSVLLPLQIIMFVPCICRSTSWANFSCKQLKNI